MIVRRFLFMLFLIQSLSFSAQEAIEEKVFNSPEQMPEFAGGPEKMMQFISANLKMPDTVLKDTAFYTCKTIVKFVIDANGKVKNEAIARECINCPDCDREALRVIASMPNWKPGQNSGKAVAVSMALPIFFVKPLKNAK